MADLSGLTRGALIEKYAAGVSSKTSASVLTHRAMANQPRKKANIVTIQKSAKPARACSREESRARRIANRAKQLGYQLDEDDLSEMAVLIVKDLGYC